MIVAALPFILAQAGPVAPGAAMAEKDPYSVGFVRYCVAMQTGGFRTGFMHKHLARLGDKVGIALLKGFSKEQLAEPGTVKAILPIVREAFAHPELISITDDTRPRVTVFLLEYLRSNSRDSQTEQEITKTIHFITHRRTGKAP
jgi:hypothetical protein